MLCGPMPLAEAMGIARQIAEAQEAAHEKGIIHRDFKPGNVMVTAAGVVKVLDLGLAKGVDRSRVSSGANSPTFTMGARCLDRNLKDRLPANSVPLSHRFDA